MAYPRTEAGLVLRGSRAIGSAALSWELERWEWRILSSQRGLEDQRKSKSSIASWELGEKCCCASPRPAMRRPYEDALPSRSLFQAGEISAAIWAGSRTCLEKASKDAERRSICRQAVHWPGGDCAKGTLRPLPEGLTVDRRAERGEFRLRDESATLWKADPKRLELEGKLCTRLCGRHRSIASLASEPLRENRHVRTRGTEACSLIQWDQI